MSASEWIASPVLPEFGWMRGNGRALIKPLSEPTSNQDLELLSRIAEGDSGALGQFYDRHSGVLFALAFRILNDHKEAEDALQDVFLQLWEKASAFNSAQGRPLAWVITLTRNRAIDRLRSAQRRVRLIEEVGPELASAGESPLPTASESAGAGEQAQMIRNALAKLPVDQRQAIEMAFFGGLTQTEISVELKEPLGTIKARIRRGMLKLREELHPLRSDATALGPANTPAWRA